MGGDCGLAGRLNRGDVHLCRFAPPDKQRPVLILTRDTAIGHLATVTVGPDNFHGPKRSLRGDIGRRRRNEEPLRRVTAASDQTRRQPESCTDAGGVFSPAVLTWLFLSAEESVERRGLRVARGKFRDIAETPANRALDACQMSGSKWSDEIRLRPRLD